MNCCESENDPSDDIMFVSVMTVSSLGGFFMYSYLTTGYFPCSLELLLPSKWKQGGKKSGVIAEIVWRNTREGWVGVWGEDFVNDFISQNAPTIFPTDDRRWKPLPESGLGESVLSPLLHTDCHFNDDFWTWTLGFALINLFFLKKIFGSWPFHIASPGAFNVS